MQEFENMIKIAMTIPIILIFTYAICYVIENRKPRPKLSKRQKLEESAFIKAIEYHEKSQQK